MKQPRYTTAHCIGTYPKWFARIIRWMVNRNKATTVKVIFKGRGRAKDGGAWPYGVPVGLAPKVSIYLDIKPKLRFPDHYLAQPIGQVQS